MTKISDYTAGTPPIDDLSEYDVSFWDGAAFVTRSFTHAELKTAFGDTLAATLVNGNTTGGRDISISTGDNIIFASSTTADPSKIVFDSSGTNKIILEDSNSDFEVAYNKYGANGILLSNDLGAASDNYMYISDTFLEFSSAVGWTSINQAIANWTVYYLTLGEKIGTSARASNVISFYQEAGAGNLSNQNNAVDTGVTAVSASTFDVDTGVVNSTITGEGGTADTSNTTHVSNLNTKIDALTSATTISLTTSPITDGAYKTLTIAHNATINAPVYSTNNSAKWTLEVTQDGTGGRTLTLGTNILTPGGVAPVISAGIGDKDILKFETDSAGNHLLVEHLKAFA